MPNPRITMASSRCHIRRKKPATKKHIPSIFLDDFFLDAGEVWKGDTSFTLSSGFWTEQNEKQVLRLEALAINSESGSRYLVVKNIEEQFDEKRKTLQAARELLLSHHEIVWSA